MARHTRRIPPELVDQVLDGIDPQTVFESDGLVDDLKRALAERILDAEMDVHLGGEAEHARGNHRNGHSKKTVLTDSSALRDEVNLARVTKHRSDVKRPSVSWAKARSQFAILFGDRFKIAD